MAVPLKLIEKQLRPKLIEIRLWFPYNYIIYLEATLSIIVPVFIVTARGLRTKSLPLNINMKVREGNTLFVQDMCMILTF